MINGNPMRDIPLGQLVSLQQRQITRRAYQRLKATILSVGLLDPLVVYPEGDRFIILEGYQCYRVLVELGVETAPCRLWDKKEAFTANRMVNYLSPAQEMRMLRKSLEELDEQTIARTFGIEGIKHRLRPCVVKRLDAKVLQAFEAGRLSRGCVRELTFVTPERQKEILALMNKSQDYSVTFARGLVLQTPAAKRAKVRQGTVTPWTRTQKRRGELLHRLREAEEQQDFYSGLYRQYSVNLLKLVMYVRSLLTNVRVKEYLAARHGRVVQEFEQVLASAEG